MVVVALPGCAAGDGEPEQIVCEVLSWADTATVSFPVDLPFGEHKQDLVVDDTLLVEFSYIDKTIRANVIDTSAGGRDFLDSYDPFTPRASVESLQVGDVVYDNTSTHPTRRLTWRVRCVAK